MASFSSLFYSYLFLLLSLLLVCPCSQVDGVEAVASYHVVSVHSLLPGDVCSTSEDLNNSSLKVVHRHGPCSPLKHRKKTTHKQILNQDQLRVNWLHRKTSTVSKQSKSQNALAAAQIPAHTGTSLGTGNYIVTTGFGTPKHEQSVVFDTGSDVTWIQCKPCVSSCYPQQEPLFDPSQSSTYRNIACSSPYCSALDRPRCSGSSCLYSVRYGDNSYTEGFFAQDTLTLTSSDVIPNFRFGCGENNNGLFGKAAGLMGLGRREQVSLVSQTSQKYGGVFSYCLPAVSSSTGYLTFGSSSVSSNVQFTPMLTDASQPTFYFLELIAISVNGQQLPIPPTIFSNAGTIIDSGTVITRLPPTAYSALRSAFRNSMTKYPSAPAVGIFDTCYNFSGYQTVTLPKVALQFRGATANLDDSGVIYMVSTSQACLAFAGNSADTDKSIIGNVQQRKFNVVYDLSKNVIGFGPGPC